MNFNIAHQINKIKKRSALTKLLEKFDIKITVTGGGSSGQAGAKRENKICLTQE